MSENPIVLENRLPGSADWKIGVSPYRISDDKRGQMQGYASCASVAAGESIDFFITTNPPQKYTLEVYRFGWYGGAGARLMQRREGLPGALQDGIFENPAQGLMECRWHKSLTLEIPKSWVSGLYRAKLTNEQGFQCQIPFAVRDAGRKADLLYQQPVTTYQAYNCFPAGSDGGIGKSLYDFNSSPRPTALGSRRAQAVSFHRPYSLDPKDKGVWSSGVLFEGYSFEPYLVGFLEERGYDVAYQTDIDTHLDTGRLEGYKGLISAGHDEYWTREMAEGFRRARDRGVHLAFLGANAMYWQVRLREATDGSRRWTLECYKDKNKDPQKDPRHATGRFRALGLPEQEIIGIQYPENFDSHETGDMAVANAGHWVWSGCGVSDGTIIKGVVGYESDRLMPNFPAPTGRNYTALSRSAVKGGESQTSIYQASSGAWVFAAGTLAWAWGLGKPGYVSETIRRASGNIFDRFVSGDG